MFTLIGLGTSVAYLYSVVATGAPGIFPETFRGHDGSVAVYVEAQGGSGEAVALAQGLLAPLIETYWPEDWLKAQLR